MGNDHAEKTVVGEVADVLNTEIAKKTYDDLAANAFKEGGGLIADVIKTIRLLTYYPFRFCAITLDKIQAGIEEAKSRVPEDRQVGAHPSIAMPVLERIGYEDDDSILREMYVNLLARAIDKERQGEAHPAFARIIEQLSRDEAQLLYDIKGEGSEVIRDLHLPKVTWWLKFKGEYRHVRGRPLDTERMACPEHLDAYFGHLAALNLVVVCEWMNFVTLFSLDAFGRLFANACIPEDFKLPISTGDNTDTET